MRSVSELETIVTSLRAHQADSESDPGRFLTEETARVQEAIEALEKSAEFSSGANIKRHLECRDWFFLAMAHWQAGNTARGRMWYDKAVELMESSFPNEFTLRRLREEAAGVLGIDEEP